MVRCYNLYVEPRTLDSTEAIEGFAAEFLARLLPREDGRATVLALAGELGAGKTAFVKSLARHLGIAEHVTSPTFVIMKQYPIQKGDFKQLVHIDAYRMKESDELLILGWNELLADKNNLIALEWPELVADIVPDTAIRLTFSHVDENTRSVART